MNAIARKRISVYDLVMVALFAALIAVCAWVTIPGSVPFTLQTMGVFLAVGLLGGKRGTAAVLVYILLGAVGMPVFSGFSGGVGRLLGTTGGYIIGFLVAALAMWAMEAVCPRPCFWVCCCATPSVPCGFWCSTPRPRAPSASLRC